MTIDHIISVQRMSTLAVNN